MWYEDVQVTFAHSQLGGSWVGQPRSPHPGTRSSILMNNVSSTSLSYHQTCASAIPTI